MFFGRYRCVFDDPPALSAVIILGGIKSIGRVSAKIVPIMAIFYAVGALIIIIVNLVRSDKARLVYRLAFIVVVFIGSITTLDIVWSFSDAANGLMAIPNLISLVVLSGVIVKQTRDFDDRFIRQEKLSRKTEKREARKKTV